MTGAGGLLGGTLVPLWQEAGASVIAWRRTDLDVTDASAVREAMSDVRPDAVVHCAAWTDVDGAEAHPDEAMMVNADGSANVARAAAATSALMMHLSTDYVFDGTAKAPIAPEAPVSPLGAYARSKAAAESRVRDAGGRWMILRAGWSYGPGGRNFVDTLKSAARDSRAVRVVNDQVGAPTSVRLIAETLWALFAAGATGVWHAAASGAASWYEVAREVYAAAGCDPARVTAIGSAELGRPAPRPAYAVLGCAATERRIGQPMPDWRAQVAHYVRHGALAPCGLLRVPA